MTGRRRSERRRWRSSSTPPDATGASGAGAAGGVTRSTGLFIRPERLKELTLLVVIGLTILAFNPFVDGYLSGRFFNRVTTGVAITAVLAVAQTLVIVTRNIDLSVGSIVGITAYTTGQFVGANPDLTPAAGVALAILIGSGLGLINGVLVAYGRVPSIVVTLGTLAIYRSFLIEYADARTITTDTLPGWVTDLPRNTVASVGGVDLRVVFLVAVVVVVIMQVATLKLRWGRWLYAIGSNPGAAQQMGLPHRRLVLSAFVGSGALSGLAGFLFLSRFGTINVAAGQGFELDSVAAAVVGGASILGGTGSFVGALLGAILIDLLDQSLVRVEAVSEFYRNAILGALILLAVIGDAALGRRVRRRRAAEARPAPELASPDPAAAAAAAAAIQAAADASAASDGPEVPSGPAPPDASTVSDGSPSADASAPPPASAASDGPTATDASGEARRA